MESLLIHCIRSQLKEAVHVDLDAPLVELGYDSYSFIELVVVLEDRLGIEFDDEALNYRRFARVAELLTYVAGRVAGASTGAPGSRPPEDPSP